MFALKVRTNESFVAVKKVGCNLRIWGKCIIPKLDWAHETIKETRSIPSRIVVGQNTLSTTEVANFKWGGECRVEVYLSTGRIDAVNRTLHGAVSAFFYEGTSENTSDLDDLQCRSLHTQVRWRF